MSKQESPNTDLNKHNTPKSRTVVAKSATYNLQIGEGPFSNTWELADIYIDERETPPNINEINIQYSYLLNFKSCSGSDYCIKLQER